MWSTVLGALLAEPVRWSSLAAGAVIVLGILVAHTRTERSSKPSPSPPRKAPMTLTARLLAVTIDCSDPLRLARFYQQFLGGELRSSHPDFVVLAGDHDTRLDFQRVANHQPPPWPDPAAPQRLHLDFQVADLGKAERYLLGVGAELASYQPGGARFRVLLDPEGHPFCLATVAAAGVPTTEPC